MNAYNQNQINIKHQESLQEQYLLQRRHLPMPEQRSPQTSAPRHVQLVLLVLGELLQSALAVALALPVLELVLTLTPALVLVHVQVQVQVLVLVLVPQLHPHLHLQTMWSAGRQP